MSSKKYNNIFSKIKDTIYNNIKGLIQTDKKATYIKSFIGILQENNVALEVQDYLKTSFEKNLTYLTDDNNLEQISNIVWLTIISTIEKNTIHIETFEDINTNHIILYGLPGSGKTTFLSKYINYFDIKNIKYTTDNPHNKTLLSTYVSSNIDSISSALSVNETNNLHSLEEYIQANYKSKVILVLDIHTNFEVVQMTIKQMSHIDYIIITKVDQLKHINLLIEIPYLTNAKIIYIANEEIANKSNKISSSTTVISIIAKKVLKKNINNNAELKQLIDSQKNNIDINTYSIYLQFINKLDRDKINNLTKLYNTASQYITTDDIEKYKQYIDQIKNPENQKKINEQARKQLYIIDSLNKKERGNPQIISSLRRKKIIAGSGTDIQTYNLTMQSFEKYKSTIKKLNLNNSSYDNIIKNF